MGVGDLSAATWIVPSAPASEAAKGSAASAVPSVAAPGSLAGARILRRARLAPGGYDERDRGGEGDPNERRTCVRLRHHGLSYVDRDPDRPRPVGDPTLIDSRIQKVAYVENLYPRR